MIRHFLIVSCALLLVSCRTAPSIPAVAVEHNEDGIRYLEEGDLDRAQQRFELALSHCEDYAQAHSNLCLVWLKRGSLELAKESCLRALRISELPEARNYLGLIYLEQRSFGKAHDAFAAAVKADPSYTEARSNLCATLSRLERVPAARACYQKLLASRPRIAAPYHDLCVLDLEDGSVIAAIRECARAVDLDPTLTDAYYRLGQAYLAAGRPCEAQIAYKRCISLDERHAECRNNLSSAVQGCASITTPEHELRTLARRHPAGP